LQQPSVGKDDAPLNMTRDSGFVSEFQNNSNRSSNVPSESGNPPMMLSGSYVPTSATGFTNRNEPTINKREYQPPAGPPPHQQESPPIPQRSMARDQNQNLVSPPNSPMGANNKQNFSYPSRTGPTPAANNAYGEQDSPIGSGPHAGAMELPAGGEMTPGVDRQPQLGASTTDPAQKQSTLSNLKAAAAGIHGVGETLRGTLNSNIDRRFPGSGDKEKQAAIVQRHDDVAAAGRNEIENQRFHDSVREREKAAAVGKAINRKPLAQQGQGDGGLRVTNQ
jgi:hypothetical protein